MIERLPPNRVEGVVGVQRHRTTHYGRAVSCERNVYVLHSQKCVDSVHGVWACRFTKALENGIALREWSGLEDVPVQLGILNGRLVPLAAIERKNRG